MQNPRRAGVVSLSQPSCEGCRGLGAAPPVTVRSCEPEAQTTNQAAPLVNCALFLPGQTRPCLLPSRVGSGWSTG